MNILYLNNIMNIILPSEKTKIAVFVSGGLDSAIMYYLILKANKAMNNLHEIVPYVIHRSDGSKYYSKLVVAHIQSQFDCNLSNLIVVGDPTLPGDMQVRSGALSAYLKGCQKIYVGVIKQLEEHIVGEVLFDIESAERDYPGVLNVPFKNTTKDEIIQLIVDNNQQPLFYITHSCSILEVGRCNSCNGCNERSWGFNQLGILDPGTI